MHYLIEQELDNALPVYKHLQEPAAWPEGLGQPLQVVGRPGAGVRDRRLGPQVAPALHDNLHHGLQPTSIWQALCWRGSSEPTT